MWYRDVIGGERCPIVDTWWQTETGQILITPLPGITVDQAGLGDARVSRDPMPRSSTQRGERRSGRRRLSRAHGAVARDDARDLGRPRALPRDLLEPLGR